MSSSLALHTCMLEKTNTYVYMAGVVVRWTYYRVSVVGGAGGVIIVVAIVDV